MIPDKKPQTVHAKQIDLLYKMLPFSLLVTTVVALLVFFFLQNFPDKTALQLWLGFLFSAVLFRAFSIVLHGKTKERKLLHIKRSETFFIIGVVLAGTAWGILGCWIYPMTTESSHHTLIIIILIGIAGASISSLAYQSLPSQVFTSLTLLPLLIGLYLANDNQENVIILAMILYFLFLIRNARTFQTNNEQLLLLKYRSTAREKKLRESQKKATANSLYLESILKSSTETAIIATDTDFRINYFNPTAELIFTMDRADVIGKTIQEIHQAKGHTGLANLHFDKIIAQIHKTGSHTFSMNFGTTAIDARISTIKDQTDTFAGFLLMANNITEQKQLDDQLRKLSRAVEQSHSTIVITDLNANIEFVNPSFTRTTGYTREEALGKNSRILQSGNQDTDFYKKMWDTLKDGRVWQGEIQNKRKDNSLYWEFTTISPVKNKEGDITHYVAVKEDISSRKKVELALEESQAQLQSYLLAIDDIGLGMLVIDGDYLIRDMNTTMIAWFGDQRGQICYKSIACRDTPCSPCHLHPVINDGKTVRYQQTAMLEDKTLDILATRVANPDKGFSKLEIIRDITEQEQAEAQLLETNIQLKEAIETAEMMTLKAESANHAKASFLANMSHEIRTPMNSIIGHTSLALENVIDKKTRDHLEMIASSSNNLLTLLNDILDFSKIEAGELVIVNNSFDLHDTVESCLNTINVLLEGKSRKVALTSTMAKDIPQAVIGDALRVRQILLNLLTNSVKFTDQGSINVLVDLLKSDKDLLYIQFKIQDTGTGIAVDKLEHIFGQFTQENDSTTRNYGGTGLGLAICQQLCRLMGGAIAVNSVVGEGSTFVFNLPLKQCDIKDLPKKTNPGKAIKNTIKPLSLLLVEDNQANLIIAKMVLEKWNHQITEAHNGLHALKVLADNDFDAILMDVQMPVMDGLSTSSIIRAAECDNPIKGVDDSLAKKLAARLKKGHIPIIAMTANAMSGDKEKCLAAGMDIYLTKPFQPVNVQDVLSQACHIRHQYRKNITRNSAEKLEQRITSYLKKIYELDGKQCSHMIKLFINTALETLESAEKAKNEKDRATFSSLGHKLKGIFLNYGLNDLVEQARTIEANESLEIMSKQLKSLQNYFNDIRAHAKTTYNPSQMN